MFTPEAKGSWPVVFALHGVGGSGQDMAELGTRLATEGAVVFTQPTAPTSRRRMALSKRRATTSVRTASRSTAAEHGGDLSEPVTFVGWSLGASFAVAGGLTEQIDPTGQYLNCFGEVARADVIVTINGCYFEYQGNKVTTPTFDTSEWGNKNADIYLLTGDQDTTCPSWQTEQAATELRTAGYDVNLVRLDGASHYAPVFHDLHDGQWVVVSDDPTGAQTVQVIHDAIAARQNDAAAREAPTRLLVGGFVEPLGERVPGEGGALDAHRELHHALQRLEVAELDLVERRRRSASPSSPSSSSRGSTSSP